MKGIRLIVDYDSLDLEDEPRELLKNACRMSLIIPH